MTCSPLPPSCTPPFGVSPSPYPSSTSDCNCECPPAGPLTANSTLNGFVTWGNTVASQWTSSLGTADALGNLNVNSLSFFGGWKLPLTGGAAGQFLGYTAGGLLGWYAITDVYTAAGTANQILVNGSSGAPVSGPITLTLPTTLVAPGSITATTGTISLGQYTGAYTDGTVVDYVTGNGRFSVGPADTISFYTGGVGSTLMGQFSSTGLFTGYLAASGTAAVKASSAFTNYGFTVGALTPIASAAGFAIGINNGGTLQAQVSGDQLYNYLSDPTIATGVGLTTLTYTGVSVGTPSVTGSSGLQNAYQVYISAPPSATNAYALYIASGAVNLGSGTTTMNGKATISLANPDVNGLTITATTGTNASAMNFSNTGGNAYVGLDSSTGTRITGSGNPYDLAVWQSGNHNVVFGVNNVVVGYFNSANLSLGSGVGLNVPGTSTLTGNVTVGSTSGGQVFGTANAGTNVLYGQLTNTGGNSYIGIDSSAGGSIITGSTAYGFNIAAAKGFYVATNGTALALTLDTSQNAIFAGGIKFTKTIAGGTGAQTQNTTTGQVQFAGAATSLVVTNSLCATTSIITANLATNDSTAVLGAVVPASGSFTIYMKTAPTGTTNVSWRLTN